MKVYVSGRIKDNVGYLEHFKEASKYLMEIGHDPVNPCDTPTQKTYEDVMREDIKQLLDCDAIYMLRGWETSAGARCDWKSDRLEGDCDHVHRRCERPRPAS